jgi:hypothetical protein
LSHACDHCRRIVAAVRELPPEQQQEVLYFAGFLGTKKKRPLKSVRGLWKDLNISLSEEDIAEARNRDVGQFPARAFFRVSAVVADTHTSFGTLRTTRGCRIALRTRSTEPRPTASRSIYRPSAWLKPLT